MRYRVSPGRENRAIAGLSMGGGQSLRIGLGHLDLNGLLAPELAAGITRIKGVKSKGVRVGNWLSIRQAQTLLNTPDVATKKGLRDRAMLAVLLGCGLLRGCRAGLNCLCFSEVSIKPVQNLAG